MSNVETIIKTTKKIRIRLFIRKIIIAKSCWGNGRKKKVLENRKSFMLVKLDILSYQNWLVLLLFIYLVANFF